MAFMYQINVDNVNQALGRGLALLAQSGLREASRNGDVAVMAGPVTTIYNEPMQRVLFSGVRNANPWFHLFESLWMLAGRNDIAWVAQFNKQMAAYSDDGLTQPAAYGHRWRKYFGYDQLDAIVAELTANPGSRRAVLAMWDGGADRDNSILVPTTFGGDLGRVHYGTADAPCNTQCYFRIVNGALDMMVTCRSNDILWGAYGANAVHFSVLLEYMAARLALPVGTMYQLSFNYHVYLEVLGGPEKARAMAQDADVTNMYEKGMPTTPIVFGDIDAFHADLAHMMAVVDPTIDDVTLLEDPEYATLSGWRTPFFADTAQPMWWAWQAFKRKDYGNAMHHALNIVGPDWRAACVAWLQRAEVRRMEKAA